MPTRSILLHRRHPLLIVATVLAVAFSVVGMTARPALALLIDCPDFQTQNADSDSDGLTDVAEDTNTNGAVDQGETDPCNADSDADGINDGIEANSQGLDPLDSDSDDDGLTDGVEDENGNGSVDQGETDPSKADTDGDGVLDGTEVGLTAPQGQDTDLNVFVADADANTKTSPLVADSDEDQLGDGTEDANGNGKVDEGETDPNKADTDADGINDGIEANSQGLDPLDSDSDDDGLTDGVEDENGNGSVDQGETDPSKADTDGDGVLDGTEVGLTAPQGQDTDLNVFVADADPTTTTDPNDEDTDGGGAIEGVEDSNKNGKRDADEGDPNNALDDLYFLDTDGDQITDGVEIAVIDSDPNDADTDDDGLTDGAEDENANGTVDQGETDPLEPDTDGDGVLDGTEVGLTEPQSEDTDLGVGNFVADADPTTTTDPNDEDTDGGSAADGAEDLNLNGMVDDGEGDPLNPFDDLSFVDSDLDGLSDAKEGTLGTDHNDDDSDDDGLLDGNEVDTEGLNPLEADSDGDGVLDGTESGLTEPEGQDTDLTVFVADADPTTTTDPTVADSDEDTLDDGTEDANGNGKVDEGETDPNKADTDGDLLGDGYENGVEGLDPLDDDSDDDGLTDGNEDRNANGSVDEGETDPLEADSDGDGVLDGTESGLSEPQGSDTDLNVFVADADPTTTTSPVVADSDQDQLGDGTEDANGNGKVDEGETDPNKADTDGDLLGDGYESGVEGLDPLDDDSDDDGLLDGNEQLAEQRFWIADEPGLIGPLDHFVRLEIRTNALEADTDGDGVLDGTELGLEEPQGSDTDLNVFVADADPTTTTNATVADSDEDTLDDGTEDANGNGKVDEGETDPNKADTDGDGLSDGAERDKHKTDPLDEDTDGDGVSDGAEIHDGTDPLVRNNAGGGGSSTISPPATPEPITFSDDGESGFEEDIEWLAAEGITLGCGGDLFCPEESVTRGQIAAFLDRALALPDAIGKVFDDTENSQFAGSISRLYAAGITFGCSDDSFCPDEPVTRGQVAALFVRAFDLPEASGDFFDDDNGSEFEDSINRLAAAGITLGCAERAFCGDQPVTRGQMAALLRRALTGGE